MATVKKGIATKSPQWWQHLRWMKRVFWKRERMATRLEIARQVRNLQSAN